jgi:DNA-binding NtrC family response regulator
MKRRDELDEYCRAWVIWSSTRKFYAQPPAKSVLARMEPAKGGKEPNARNYPDMTYFNMAIHTLADMKKHQADYAAFMACYTSEDEVVKRVIDKLGIGRQTYYDRVKRFAKDAHNLSLSLKRAAESYSTLSDEAQAATYADEQHVGGRF